MNELQPKLVPKRMSCTSGYEMIHENFWKQEKRNHQHSMETGTCVTGSIYVSKFDTRNDSSWVRSERAPLRCCPCALTSEDVLCDNGEVSVGAHDKGNWAKIEWIMAQSRDLRSFLRKNCEWWFTLQIASNAVVASSILLSYLLDTYWAGDKQHYRIENVNFVRWCCHDCISPSPSSECSCYLCISSTALRRELPSFLRTGIPSREMDASENKYMIRLPVSSVPRSGWLKSFSFEHQSRKSPAVFDGIRTAVRFWLIDMRFYLIDMWSTQPASRTHRC